ncbi:alpha/beta-Hydrolase [Glarea lozoyensis ATCC 20868]|uniref:cutinase n=2 Tax=Glarea lozoyensis TaxID=101852 RepID=S3DGE6_GLAL2|nr:alpha/beta-Hydrolase [Glarea lozoyensis ATCC 20868]EHK97646.1 putative Cutinase [Glarea lozoyensis 74030]EPE25678.1 alpha/beta-Hydrolase [Glarea lozoyensis ATCC 20868]
MRFSTITLLSLASLALASPIAAPIPKAVLTRDQAEKRQTPLNAFLDLLLDYLPAVDGTINAVAGILTTFESFLAALTGEQTTYNELGNTCKPYTVIFARGTTEPGNVGILVGPPFLKALDMAAGAANVVVQGVNNYAADVQGYLAGGDAKGSADMAAKITTLKAKCPNTKLITAGYSQGGQIIHNAAKLLPAATAQWISKVIIFGDPYSKQPVANVAESKRKTFCNAGDNICVNGPLILSPHLLYGLNAVEAAKFATS